jgi:hypothetical protein
MSTKFSVADIYDKNLNILVGAGASYGLFPTLALNVQDHTGAAMTVETLATTYTKGRDDPQYTALFVHYYKTCIEPVLITDYVQAGNTPERKTVLEQYCKLLKTILHLLSRKRSAERKVCNLFTTNYDGCFAYAAEELLREGAQFHVNDGTLGFRRRYLDARNFNTHLTQTGTFGKHRNDLPQVNIIQLHGSAYWHKLDGKILIDYNDKNEKRLIKDECFAACDEYSKALMGNGYKLSDLPKVELSQTECELFWSQYDTLPIVNPTKWKFHETVFEEHYYQMLRYLSYELERPNSILLTFGFSFADEHIRNLVKRAISNPSLQIFVCCFSEFSAASIKSEFAGFDNIKAIVLGKNMNFSIFNDEIFNVDPKVAPIIAEGA